MFFDFKKPVAHFNLIRFDMKELDAGQHINFAR